MNLPSTTMDLINALQDAIPAGDHPAPHNEWVPVRLDLLEAISEALAWNEKGIQEWRDLAQSKAREATASRAVSRIILTLMRGVVRGDPGAKALAEDYLQAHGDDSNATHL